MTTQLPFNSFYNFSFTEQIYLASEIQFAGYIKAISFRIAYSYNIGSVADGETVAIYDVFGRLIKQETYNAGLNISGLEKGVYAVKIKTEVLRFVKE